MIYVYIIETHLDEDTGWFPDETFIVVYPLRNGLLSSE